MKPHRPNPSRFEICRNSALARTAKTHSQPVIIVLGDKMSSEWTCTLEFNWKLLSPFWHTYSTDRLNALATVPKNLNHMRILGRGASRRQNLTSKIMSPADFKASVAGLPSTLAFIKRSPVASNTRLSWETRLGMNPAYICST